MVIKMAKTLFSLLVILLMAHQNAVALTPQPMIPGQSYWPGPTGYPTYTPPVQQRVSPVRLEARLDTTQAYVYQNLVLTLDVISSENLATLKFTLPRSDAFVFKPLGKLSAIARKSGKDREIVTSQRYLVIPLRDGIHSLEKLAAEGSARGSGSFELEIQAPIQLTVKASVPEVQPWLPVEELTLSARLSNEEKLKQGEPATLVLEITGKGITGAQLPSLEKQLQSADLRVYREKTDSMGELTREGKLIGKRVEQYTLLPGNKRRLVLPALEVQWWNVATSKSEKTFMSKRFLGINEKISSSISEEFGLLNSDGAWVFWQPLLIIAFVTGLYWSWLWARGRSLGQRYAHHIMIVTEPLRRKVNFLLLKLSPRRWMHRIRRFFADSLPRSWRLWYCVRVADNETSPEIWIQVLRFLMERRLGITGKTSTHQLAEYIIKAHPGADASQMRKMLYQLDAAIYGNTQLEDFANWKKQFKREIRPRLFPAVFSRFGGIRKQGLPSLNP